MTLLQYNVDNVENSDAQNRLFGRNEEDEMFQQIVFVNSKLEELFYLIVLSSVYGEVKTIEHIWNAL